MVINCIGLNPGSLDTAAEGCRTGASRYAKKFNVQCPISGEIWAALYYQNYDYASYSIKETPVLKTCFSLG